MAACRGVGGASPRISYCIHGTNPLTTPCRPVAGDPTQGTPLALRPAAPPRQKFEPLLI